MSYDSNSVDLRLTAVFLMGVSVGICLMLVYFTWRGPHHEVTIERPSAEREQVDE